MKKIVFLILHYINIKETKKCVDTIKKIIEYKNYEIVIVDNGSKNNTGFELQKMYEKDKGIHVLLSDDNLGFARGNNFGFKYAKEKLKADYIIMINSDVYMLQSNFCELIEEEYKKSKFAVLGPRIIVNNNRICDYVDEMPNLSFFKKRKIQIKLFLYFNKINLAPLYVIICSIFNSIFSKNKIIDTSIRKENLPLNGCCLIFSKEYITKYDGIDDRTFLYYEEFLLCMRLKKSNLKSVYNPYLIVYHNESASTNTKYKNRKQKIDFVLKNELKSISIVINDLEND